MEQIENLNILGMIPLISPSEIKTELPISEATNKKVSQGRQEIQRILQKEDSRLLIIVGPCSIHNAELALEYATKLQSLQARYRDRLLIVMRVYFDKPRSTIGWRGFMNDPHMNFSNNVLEGLRQTRALLLKINELDLLAATEVLDPFVPQYVSDLLAWGAIGARTTESQTHRTLASGLSMPIGFKNSMEGNIQIAVDAIISAAKPHTFLGINEEGQPSVVYTKGNPLGHVILRGGRQTPNYTSSYLLDASKCLRDAQVMPALVVDCSHHNSGYNHTQQSEVWTSVISQRTEGNTDIVGLMLESNLYEGKQVIPADPGQLRYGVSVTDSCIGWEETEALLKFAYDKVKSTTISPVNIGQ